MNQVELELEMADGGRAKALSRFNANEDSGSAHANPYAQALYRRYVLPMRDAIKLYLESRTRGVAGKNKVLLRNVDPLTLAFITVRGLMDKCLADCAMPLSTVSHALGKTVYGEVLLEHFADINPELYFTLVQDFERRMTKSERHRIAVFQDSARKDGITLPKWDVATVGDVGKLLCGVANDLGFIDFQLVPDRRKTTNHVILSEEARALIINIKGYVAGLMPMVMPCVEPPLDWTSPNDGGYHTPAMRRTVPCFIRGVTLIDDGTVPPFILAGANLLQRTAWQVNDKVLEVATIAHERFDVQDVLVSDRRAEAPQKPLWLEDQPDLKFADMAPMQQVEFKEWAALKREWHTEDKIRGSKAGATTEALYMANRFRGRPLWFVYTADYRGRFYASARGISPQGADLAKALLHLHRGYAIEDAEAEFWFRVAGANKWAQDKIDKAPLEDRAQWSVDNDRFICAIAEDPISNRDWTNADVPFQFLAWCFEYAEWRADPLGFRTRIPLGQDGSCNGLQHFSAMLRDSIGGGATNLVPDTRQHDIYDEVAKATTRLVGVVDPLDEGTVAERWRQHTLSRGLVKRSVMTLPYGSTRFSSSEFIQKEYLDKKQAPEFDKSEYNKAATWLSFRVWDGIGEVVVKGREAMEWLQNRCDELTQSRPATLSWYSPSGFHVTQRYNKSEIIRVQSRIVSGRKLEIALRTFKDEGDSRRHRNGIAPNFVHSCDAAHMHLFLRQAEAEGLTDLALVHDDYGVPAPMVAKLHRVLRESFVRMYQDNNPLLAFALYHKLDPTTIPKPGDLDITKVLESRYFFC